MPDLPRTLAVAARPQPVRSTCVSAAGEVDGRGRKSLGPPGHSRCAVVGRHSHRGDGHPGGHRDRRGIRPPGADLPVRRLLRDRLCGRGARGPPVRHLHRGGAASAHPVRRGAHGVLPVPPRRDRRNQGHPDQLRLPADRALPADVHDVGGGAADRDGPLVLRRGRPRRQGHPKPPEPRSERVWSPGSRRRWPRCSTGARPTDAEDEVAEPVRRPRKHTIDRPATAARPPRERRTTNRAAPSRSRHARPPDGRPRRTGARPTPALRRPHPRRRRRSRSSAAPSAAHAARTGRAPDAARVPAA